MASFTLVLYGFSDVSDPIGIGCNESVDGGCEIVFRARATCFACLTWFWLFLAWEVVDTRHIFFHMEKPGSKSGPMQWVFNVWRIQFLVWRVLAGFIT